MASARSEGLLPVPPALASLACLRVSRADGAGMARHGESHDHCWTNSSTMVNNMLVFFKYSNSI
jgi:hypothetical protein